jgi:hypothetical protein
MSTTITTLVAPMKGVSEKQCPMCWGEGILQDGSGAHDRIQELEGQVHALTARASATGKPLPSILQIIQASHAIARLRDDEIVFCFPFSVQPDP